MLVGTCPYYLYDRGDMLFCEGATLKYPDKSAKRECLHTYCCSEEFGFKGCTLHGILEDYYSRLYGEDRPEHKAAPRQAGAATGRPSKFNGGR